jgi:hypothetical protein
VQDKCSLLDGLGINSQVKVSFNLRGRKWEKDGQTSYFTNLDAWKIENEQSTSITPNTPGHQDTAVPDNSAPFPEDPPADDSGFDDLPF